MEEKQRKLRPPFWPDPGGYSAFQYILLGRIPKTNRCASRFAGRLGYRLAGITSPVRRGAAPMP